MENLLLKEILKLVVVFVGPLTILCLLFFSGQPMIALAFLMGSLLGILRLKVFFGYIARSISQEESAKKAVPLITYLASLVFTLAAIGFVLIKAPAAGLAMLVGLVMIPVVVTIYAAMKGIELFRNR